MQWSIDMSATWEQLGYSVRYARLKDGLAEYIEQYRRYRSNSGG